LKLLRDWAFAALRLRLAEIDDGVTVSVFGSPVSQPRPAMLQEISQEFNHESVARSLICE
jgi:hypothetical protein